MRSDAFKRDVSVSEELPTAAFTIQGNAKMFSILADKLYSDKPRAVIREISANALDAHGMNGQTRPFDISLPNHMEPMLIIRDYGPGMSDDDVMMMYTSFGASTKDQGNDAIGGFGLGCKSPFAYADAFTVSSVQAGVKRNYAAYRGSDGIPQMTRVGEEATDEPDGIKVCVPIKDNDWWTFEQTAIDLLQHFPEGSFNPHGIEVSAIEYVSKHDGYWVRKAKPPKPYVLMGPIAYPVDWTLILEEGDVALPETVIMVFDIGSLDLQPNREGLSYDNLTLATLRQRYRSIADAYAEEQFALIQKLNRFEQVLHIASLKENKTWSMIAKRWPTTYEERKEGDKSVLRKELTTEGFPGITDRVDIAGRPSTTRLDAKGHKGVSFDVYTTRPEKLALEAKDLNERSIFIFDDMQADGDFKRRLTSRYKQACHDRGLNAARFYLFDKEPGVYNSLKREFEDIAPTYATFEDLQAALVGWAHADTNVVRLSDLPTMAAAVRSGTGRKTELRVTGIRLGQSHHTNSARWYTNCWEEQPGLAEGGVYAPLSGTGLEDGFPQGIMNCEWRLQELPLLLGLTKKARDQIRKDGTTEDYVRLDVYLRERYDNEIADEAILNELARQATMEDFSKDPVAVAALSIAQRRPELFPSITERVAPLIDPGQAIRTRVSRLRDYATRAKLVLPKVKKFKVSAIKEIHKVHDRSPLLRTLVKSERSQDYSILRHFDHEDLMAFAGIRRTLAKTVEE